MEIQLSILDSSHKVKRAMCLVKTSPKGTEVKYFCSFDTDFPCVYGFIILVGVLFQCVFLLLIFYLFYCFFFFFLSFLNRKMDSTDDSELFIAELLVFISVSWTSNSHALKMLKEYFCNIILLKILFMSGQWKNSLNEQRWKFLGIYFLLNVVKELRQNELK